MNALKWLAACMLLAVPASSYAVGASISIGGGVASAASSNQFRSAVEVSPFYDLAFLRLEVPLEVQLKPTSSFSIRPGAKLFIPAVGLYGRAGIGFQNLTGKADSTKSLILGLGYEFTVLDTAGIFFEGTYEPSLETNGPRLTMARAGALLNF
jgi:hypothetical protein